MTPGLFSNGGIAADLAFVANWIRALGNKLSRGRRLRIDTLADGRAHLTVEYPTLGELLAVLEEIDGLIAMAAEHAAAQGALRLTPRPTFDLDDWADD